MHHANHDLFEAKKRNNVCLSVFSLAKVPHGLDRANHSAKAWVKLDHLQRDDWSVYAADVAFADSLM